MIATFKPCNLKGSIAAPPSKSMAHRYLIGAALSGQECMISGVDYSEDILATLDCLSALGAKITKNDDVVTLHPDSFMTVEAPILSCRESGSTLRFLIPLALCLGKPVVFKGSQRLMERPMELYASLCRENGFVFHSDADSITVCGNLKSGNYQLRGDVSSQFISGLLFALVFLNEDASIEILPPFESRSYVDLTISALQAFGADVTFSDDYTVCVKKSSLHGFCGTVEGDYSNAAFLDAFNYIGSDVTVTNLNPHSLQGDRVYTGYFAEITNGIPTLDISNCPDLGPVLFAMAALHNGATFTGTDRLKIKESDRGTAMHQELQKLGGGLLFGDNVITVPKQKLQYIEPIDGHNDHRIVMAMSIILSKTGGTIRDIEAVRKSYPGFFEDIRHLGAEVEII